MLKQEIKIYVPELKYQKTTEVNKALLTLDGDWLTYEVDFHADEPVIPEDWSGGTENVQTFIKADVLKKNITSIDLENVIDPNRWVVILSITGRVNDIKMYFNKFDNAVKIHNTILLWLKES